MKVSREYLENKINELNQWLFSNPESSPQRGLIIDDRNRYVDRLVEMDKGGLTKVEL